MSINQDPYLIDHVINGAVVLPLVLLLELLAKNSASIAGKKKLFEIKNIKINSPVIFSDSSPVEIRSFSAVSKDSDNLIVSVIRTSLDGFTNNVVTCEFYYDNLKKSSELVALPKALKDPIDIEKFIPVPLFHGKFFRHLEKIVSLKENCCAATWKKGEKRSLSFLDFKKSATIFPTLVDSMLQTALVMANKLVLPVSIGKIEFFSHKIPENGICLANEKSIFLCDDSGRKLVEISDLKVSEVK